MVRFLRSIIFSAAWKTLSATSTQVTLTLSKRLWCPWPSIKPPHPTAIASSVLLIVKSSFLSWKMAACWSKEEYCNPHVVMQQYEGVPESISNWREWFAALDKTRFRSNGSRCFSFDSLRVEDRPDFLRIEWLCASNEQREEQPLGFGVSYIFGACVVF